MQNPDEKIKEILELKERITAQIEKHEEEIEYLRKNIQILDSVLKNSSFTKASSLSTSEEKQQEKALIPITKGANGEIIANAHVSPDKVSIIIDEKIDLSADTPPFKTFFIDRIIGEMKKKDLAEVSSGKLKEEGIIDYVINQKGSNIREIIIKNYRQQERVKEIINTAAWSLSRMLENSK